MKTYFERYGYLAVTLLSSFVTFIKSYFFMDILSKEELGYMALFQSMILIVNFFQLGVVYGGYRVISFSILRQKKTNEAVSTYLFLLALVFVCLFLLFNLFISLNWFWIIGVLVGIFSLLANWLSNLHIALGRTNRLSCLTLFSILSSFIAMPLVYSHHLYGAVLLVALQPFFLIILSYIFNKDFTFQINVRCRPYLWLILKLGFIPFLTGILHYINLQIERWVIGVDLGIEALGNYYLAFVYVGLFSVIPSALGTLNFPKFMKLLGNKKNSWKNIIRIFRIYYLEIFAYLIIISIGTLYIMPLLIKIVLPEHESAVQYVRIILVGLTIFTLIDPISFIINASLHYKDLLYIYIIAVFISVLSYAILFFCKKGSLINYSYVNVIFYVTISLGYIIYFLRKGVKSSNDILLNSNL